MHTSKIIPAAETHELSTPDIAQDSPPAKPINLRGTVSFKLGGSVRNLKSATENITTATYAQLVELLERAMAALRQSPDDAELKQKVTSIRRQMEAKIKDIREASSDIL